jgi:hypothetical protein
MTVQEARTKYNLNQNWHATEMPDGRIFFSFYDDDIIVRADGTAYELRWVLTSSYGHDITKTELAPEVRQ